MKVNFRLLISFHYVDIFLNPSILLWTTLVGFNKTSSHVRFLTDLSSTVNICIRPAGWGIFCCCCALGRPVVKGVDFDRMRAKRKKSLGKRFGGAVRHTFFGLFWHKSEKNGKTIVAHEEEVVWRPMPANRLIYGWLFCIT